jgi:hypothetical protein
MHLNQLYGIFGRKKDLIETINVYNKDIINYLSTRIVKNIIQINDEISTLLIINNIEADIITKLNLKLETNLKNNFSVIKNNVAIAAAVTSYARIHMMKYKAGSATHNDSIVYTDTDSIFTTEKLNNEELGKDLGLMKDELDGCIINEGYFLGIKRYGYIYTDKNNIKHEKSVFSGIKRDSLTFEEVQKIFKGETIEKNVPIKFYKSFNNLNITIKSNKISVSMKKDKLLINNNYIPIHINETNLSNNSLYCDSAALLKNKSSLLFI